MDFFRLKLFSKEERDIDFFGKMKLNLVLDCIPTVSGVLSFSVTHL